MRYLIASFLPPEIDSQIRSLYLKLTNQALNIKHLHLTLLPPFSPLPHTSPTSLLAPLKTIQLHLLSFNFSTPNFFSGDEKSILYLPIIPPEPLHSLYSQLSSQYSSLIQYDLSVYPNHQLPPFLPHFTLDYDYQGDQSAILNTLQPLTQIPGFHLQNPRLMAETIPHQWSVYQED